MAIWRIQQPIRSLRREKLDGKQCYFIATAYWKKGLHLLSIVDYRNAEQIAVSFQSIIAAGKVLCLPLAAMPYRLFRAIEIFDNALYRNLFFKPGKPGLLYTNAPQVTEHATMSQRDRIFATLTDGDGELNSHYGG